jgi:hypothetical protein
LGALTAATRHRKGALNILLRVSQALLRQSQQSQLRLGDYCRSSRAFHRALSTSPYFSPAIGLRAQFTERFFRDSRRSFRAFYSHILLRARRRSLPHMARTIVAGAMDAASHMSSVAAATTVRQTRVSLSVIEPARTADFYAALAFSAAPAFSAVPAPLTAAFRRSGRERSWKRLAEPKGSAHRSDSPNRKGVPIEASHRSGRERSPKRLADPDGSAHDSGSPTRAGRSTDCLAIRKGALNAVARRPERSKLDSQRRPR